MTRRRSLALFAALALGAGAFLLLRDDDERRIARQLTLLERALSSPPNEGEAERSARVQRAFEESLSDTIVIRIPDFPELSRGRDVLARAASRAGTDPRGSVVRASDVQIGFEKHGRAATVTATVELSRPGDELHKDERQVRLRFEELSGHWRVTSVEASAKSRVEPEARP